MLYSELKINICDVNKCSGYGNHRRLSLFTVSVFTDSLICGKGICDPRPPLPNVDENLHVHSLNVMHLVFALESGREKSSERKVIYSQPGPAIINTGQVKVKRGVEVR